MNFKIVPKTKRLLTNLLLFLFYSVFSPWIPVKSCSASCGGGVTTEVRSCLNQDLCFGPTELEVRCNTQECPGLIFKK